MQERVFSSSAYRYGFNGKEEETDGTADNYDFGARIYDGRLGRWLAVDPLYFFFKKYSTYNISVNSPIRLLDIDGQNPGDVVVAFGGGDYKMSGDKGITAPKIIEQVTSEYLKDKGGVAKTFSSDFWSVSPSGYEGLDDATQEAFDFIVQNFNKNNGENVKGGKVIIYGYSMGGVLANHLTCRLANEGIYTDLLITVDAAAAWRTNEVDRTVHPMVKRNINLYQTTESTVGSFGAENSAENSNKTQVQNGDYTGDPTIQPGVTISHDNIDDETLIPMKKEIVEELKNR